MGNVLERYGKGIARRHRSYTQKTLVKTGASQRTN